MPGDRPYDRPRSAPHRTTSGRVVYNRAFHAFGYGDAIRIVRRLPEVDSLKEYLQILGMVLILGDRLRDAVLRNLYGINLSQAAHTVLGFLIPLLQAWRESLPSDSGTAATLDKALELLVSL